MVCYAVLAQVRAVHLLSRWMRRGDGLLALGHAQDLAVASATAIGAVANAEEQDADVTRLVVCESRVDEGPVIKRWRPKDRGRAHPIRKPTSHLVVAVQESN